MDPVTTGGKRMILDHHVMGNREDSILICTRAPGTQFAIVETQIGHSPWDQFAPNVSAAIFAREVNPRTGIINRYRYQTHVLRDRRSLIVARRRTRDVLGDGKDRENERGEKS